MKLRGICTVALVALICAAGTIAQAQGFGGGGGFGGVPENGLGGGYEFGNTGGFAEIGHNPFGLSGMEGLEPGEPSQSDLDVLLNPGVAVIQPGQFTGQTDRSSPEQLLLGLDFGSELDRRKITDLRNLVRSGMGKSQLSRELARRGWDRIDRPGKPMPFNSILVPPGGITNDFIRANKLACLRTNEDGLTHLCPKSVDDDYLDFRFDPYGFTDVVTIWTPIFYVLPAEISKGDFCTGVRISDQYILSALHCLGGIRHSAGQIMDPPVSADGLWHKIDHSQTQAVDGLDGWTKIVLADDFHTQIYMNNSPFGTVLVDGWYYILKENRPKIAATTVFLPVPVDAFQSSTALENSWPTLAANDTNPDLILIQLDEPKTLKINRFSVMAPVVDADDLRQFTFAGFGKTSLAGRDKSTFSILAALSFLGSRDGQYIGWTRNDALGGSVPCKSDSGGPLFAGMNFGLPNETHILLGLVRDTPENPDANGCGLSRGRATAIDIHREAICWITKDTAAGCNLLDEEISALVGKNRFGRMYE